MYRTGITSEKGIFSRKFSSVASVAAVHVLVAYALLVGTGNKLTVPAHPTLTVEIVNEKKRPPPEESAPKVPMTKVAPPLLRIPLPEIRIEQPAQPPALHAVAFDGKADSLPREIARYEQDGMENGSMATDAWLDTNSCELPPYPWQLSNREQGTVILGLLIDVDGHVLESRVIKSSGVRLLDEAARNGMSLCKYRPGEIDGTPQKVWKKLRFIWQLPY